jgi:VanZ family protein
MLRRLLLGAYLLALVYGSLYPLSGWRATGQQGIDFLFDPWPRYWTWFDLLSNVLIYLPFGALLSASHADARRLRSIVVVVLLAASVSLALETLQGFLPGRVPSRADWLANMLGALLGASAARLADRTSVWPRRQWRRQSIPGAESAAGLALLGAWLLLQIHPQRLLFGHGDLLEPLARMLSPILGRVFPGQPTGADPIPVSGLQIVTLKAGIEYSAPIEAFATSAAVVGVGLIVREIWPARAPRMAITAALLGAALLIRGTAAGVLLGPAQSVTWLTAGAQGGLVTGAAALSMLASGRRRARLWIAVAAISLTAVLTSLFPEDAYSQSMMQRWDRGAWRNFHGLLQALALLWPLAAIGWCLARLRALRAADLVLMKVPKVPGRNQPLSPPRGAGQAQPGSGSASKQASVRHEPASPPRGRSPGPGAP